MIERTLSQVGIDFRQQAGQLVIDCPYCGKAKHCYIDQEKRVFYCQACTESGTWSTLRGALMPDGATITPMTREKKTFTPPSSEYVSGCHNRLLGKGGTVAIEYLYSRKFSLDAIHHFRLGLESKDGRDWLVIPYIKNGKPVNVKYRTLPPADKDFRRWEGGESILFNQDCLKGLADDDEVFITEGEPDCIALFSQGFRNVVATTIGANGIKPAWIDQLARFKRISVVYDSDEKGRKGAKDLARRLGEERCYDVVLPVKDANDFFIGGASTDDFNNLARKAEQFETENILTLGKIFQRLIYDSKHADESGKLTSQWPNVAKLTGPYEPGDLIILTATPKTGKTTFALNEALYFAKTGNPAFVYCLEMRPERLTRKVFQIELGVTEEELTQYRMGEAYRHLYNVPLLFGYNYKKCDLEIVTETIRRGVRRYGFRFVVFDNLHYLARSITHQVQEVGLISKTFKLLAEELQIPIMLIAQPRKVSDDQVVGMQDLKDSSAIGADGDIIVVLYRKKARGRDDLSFEPTTLVRVDASRFRPGGETLLDYHGDIGRFEQVSAAAKQTTQRK